jgi:hypothetical protein
MAHLPFYRQTGITLIDTSSSPAFHSNSVPKPTSRPPYAPWTPTFPLPCGWTSWPDTPTTLVELIYPDFHPLRTLSW